MNATVHPAPFREVVHIEQHVSERRLPRPQQRLLGPQHATALFLSLSCGHLEVRQLRAFGFAPKRALLDAALAQPVGGGP